MPIEAVYEEQKRDADTSTSNERDTPYEDEVGNSPKESTPTNNDGSAPQRAHSKQEDDDEENETCGFCKFMKGGGCRDAFVAWSGCVDRERDAGGDFTEECKEAVCCC